MRAFIAYILLLFSVEVHADSVFHSIGRAYCALTHPAELLGNVRNSTCEKQHVIQQQSNGGHSANTVWWAASDHVRTDVWNDKPWQNNHPWMVLGFSDDNEKNLKKAYMLGTFGVNWSMFQHDYSGKKSSLIMTDFDGVSNLLYGYSWLINIPQKIINRSAYITDKGHLHLWVDSLLLILVVFLEGAICLFCMVGGAVLGTVFNPIDTILAIPGGLWLAAETTVAAISQYVFGMWRMLTSGLWGIVLLVPAIILSFINVIILGNRNS